jgi:hypothetical protein
MMNGNPIIAHVLFTDGARRAVYQEASGKQYVLDDEGEKVHGVCFFFLFFFLAIGPTLPKSGRSVKNALEGCPLPTQ